jgi:hypothetical protein
MCAAMLIPLSATESDEPLISLAKNAIRRNLKDEDSAKFRDVYVSQLYHIENGKRVHRGNTICVGPSFASHGNVIANWNSSKGFRNANSYRDAIIAD